jgi:hypothetical protein
VGGAGFPCPILDLTTVHRGEGQPSEQAGDDADEHEAARDHAQAFRNRRASRSATYRSGSGGARAIESRPMVESSLPDHQGDPNDRLVFRRGKLRRREDDEVRMMREALADLGDLPQVKRLLLELGRFYNPVTNAPVVAADLRRRVIGLLEAGDTDGARTLLESHLAEYRKMDDRPSSPAG